MILRNKHQSDDRSRLLNKYTHGAGKVYFPSVTSDIEQIPEWWRKLSCLTSGDRVTLALNQWESITDLQVELRKTLAYLRSYCQDVEVMQVGSNYFLLYSILNRFRRMVYFTGGNPLEAKPSAGAQRLWLGVPKVIKDFYGLHDGFFDFESAAGFDQQSALMCLGDEEWGLIETLGLPVNINLPTSLSFVASQSGTYLVVDVNDCIMNKATLWSSQTAPRYNLNFWDVADEWIIAFFESE